MLFPTYEFALFFLVVFTLGMFLKKRVTIYKYFLLIASLVFYSFWSFKFLGLLVTDLVANYLILQGVTKTRHKRTFLFLGVILNIGYLGFFKYYDFFVDSLFQILNSLQLQFSPQVLQIIAPVGISFYTFRIISHVVDCYKQQTPCPSLIDYGTYVIYFPQIGSGPISRAGEFYQQLNSKEKYNYQIEEVVVLIISGLFKKYTLSSFLFNFTQLPFSLPQQYSSVDLILSALAYSCLIYVDFSGYSDLANAISSLLGFKPVLNFNMPYQSKNLQEFWRRWHISLSEWLRDYLYIPLGGSRKGKLRKHFNLLATMVIGGFWHGAGLNFIIWGALHGVGLIINHLWRDLTKFGEQGTGNRERYKVHYESEKRYKLEEIKANVASTFSILLTFTFTTITWIFFTTPNFDSAIKFIEGIINFNSGVSIVQFNVWQLYVVFAIILGMNFAGDTISKGIIRILSGQHLIFKTAFVSGVLYTVLRLGPNTVPPFIYFNF